MRHDPERLAAAYLADELGDRRKERYEAHLLECEHCWREVRAARRGRLLAESLRQVAPPGVRDRIRAVTALAPEPPPRRRPPPRALLTTAATVVLIVLMTTVALVLGDRIDRHAQPGPIAAAIAAYQSPSPSGTAVPNRPPVAAIGALTWRSTTRHDLAGLGATLFWYADGAGHRLLIVRSPRPIPTAHNARPLSAATTGWTATSGTAVLFCADQPGTSWLAVGPDRNHVLAAGRALGLR